MTINAWRVTHVHNVRAHLNLARFATSLLLCGFERRSNNPGGGSSPRIVGLARGSRVCFWYLWTLHRCFLMWVVELHERVKTCPPIRQQLQSQNAKSGRFFPWGPYTSLPWFQAHDPIFNKFGSSGGFTKSLSVSTGGGGGDSVDSLGSSSTVNSALKGTNHLWADFLRRYLLQQVGLWTEWDLLKTPCRLKTLAMGLCVDEVFWFCAMKLGALVLSPFLSPFPFPSLSSSFSFSPSFLLKVAGHEIRG